MNFVYYFHRICLPYRAPELFPRFWWSSHSIYFYIGLLKLCKFDSPLQFYQTAIFAPNRCMLQLLPLQDAHHLSAPFVFLYVLYIFWRIKVITLRYLQHKVAFFLWQFTHVPISNHFWSVQTVTWLKNLGWKNYFNNIQTWLISNYTNYV